MIEESVYSRVVLQLSLLRRNRDNIQKSDLLFVVSDCVPPVLDKSRVK